MPSDRPLAVVTGASRGIGYALAKQCVEHGFDLFVVADEPSIHDVTGFRDAAADVQSLQADLSTAAGIQSTLDAIHHLNRPVYALLANAGIGLGKGFLDQDLEQALKVVDTNITGTLRLIHPIARE